jgi:type II secretory pathway predicted ATPase ExeA
MNNSKNKLNPVTNGFIAGGILTCSALGLIAYMKKKPTDAMLNLQQAQFLFNNKFKSNLPYKSIHYDDVQMIKTHMTQIKKNREQGFKVVIGPKGVGKTTAVMTAADGLPGVVSIIDVRPNTHVDVILERVVRGINGSLWDKDENYFQREQRLLEIIQAFKVISGGQAPIVIIPAM